MLKRIIASAVMATATHTMRPSRSQRPRKEEVAGGEACALISPTPRPSSLGPSVTTPLYSTTVSQALRQTLRSRRSKANFYEKALFVKADVAAALWLTQPLSLPFALCFYPHSRGAHTLFGGSVHRMRSVLIRTNRALQSSERFLLCR